MPYLINMATKDLINNNKGSISQIKEEIKVLKDETKVLKKLYVILDVLYDVPVKKIMEKYDISSGTVYNWIHQWNEGGIDALKRKKGTGTKSKLTDEQFIILDVVIQQMNLKTSKEIQRAIRELFGVEYSTRQITRIMKKLGYKYTKPYQIYNKMPDNAFEELSLKTSHLDTKNYKIGFLDQSYCQNQDNSQRSYEKIGKKTSNYNQQKNYQ